MAKWKKRALGNLIQAFKQHPCLYDVHSLDYLKQEASRNALQAILEVVKPYRPQSTITEVKLKLISLRCQYMREYRRVCSSKRGTDISVYIPRFWWYDKLHFVRDQRPKGLAIVVQEHDAKVKKKHAFFEYAAFGNFVSYTMSKMTKRRAQKFKHAIMRLIIEIETEEEDE